VLQVTRLALMNSKLTQSLSMHNLATGFGSDSDTSGQLILSPSVVDPHHVDADPESTYHPDADPDDADPDPDPDPDPTFHLDANVDLDPNPGFQIKPQTLERELK
jgi:hypothetical protein